MSLVVVLIFAVLLGIVCGLRSMLGPAIVCWGAQLGWLQLEHSHLAFLHSKVALIVFTLLAIGELIADKTPKVPSRIEPFPLVARFISGALCGAALCISASKPMLAGALLGGTGAVAGAFAGYHVRHWMTTVRALPDLPIAVVEDLIALGVGLFIVSRFAAPVTVVL